NERNWEFVEDQMNKLLPHAIAQVEWRPDDMPREMPFSLNKEELTAYAAGRAGRRLNAISSARGMPLAQLDVDASPEEQEEQFGGGDAAEREQVTSRGGGCGRREGTGGGQGSTGRARTGGRGAPWPVGASPAGAPSPRPSWGARRARAGGGGSCS